MSETPNDALLVRRAWLEKVDAALFGGKPTEAAATSPSLFYAVRPAVLKSEWTQNAAGAWHATAAFVVNDVIDESFTFAVYAPTSTSNPGGTVDTSRMYVVWRGRWEKLGVTATMTSVVKSATIEPTTTTISYLSSVGTEDGALVFTTKMSTVTTDVDVQTTTGEVVGSV